MLLNIGKLVPPILALNINIQYLKFCIISSLFFRQNHFFLSVYEIRSLFNHKFVVCVRDEPLCAAHMCRNKKYHRLTVFISMCFDIYHLCSRDVLWSYQGGVKYGPRVPRYNRNLGYCFKTDSNLFTWFSPKERPGVHYELMIYCCTTVAGPLFRLGH